MLPFTRSLGRKIKNLLYQLNDTNQSILMEGQTQQQQIRQPRRCNIGNYVTIYYSDGRGNYPDVYIPEAELPHKIRPNRPLVVRPCISLVRKVDLGTVLEVRDYVKRQHIEVRTENGWFYIEVNKSLQILLGDRIGWLELLE